MVLRLVMKMCPVMSTERLLAMLDKVATSEWLTQEPSAQDVATGLVVTGGLALTGYAAYLTLKLWQLYESDREAKLLVGRITKVLEAQNADLSFTPPEFLHQGASGLFTHGSTQKLYFRRSSAEPGLWEWSFDHEHWHPTSELVGKQRVQRERMDRQASFSAASLRVWSRRKMDPESLARARDEAHARELTALNTPNVIFVTRLHLEYLARKRAAAAAAAAKVLPLDRPVRLHVNVREVAPVYPAQPVQPMQPLAAVQLYGSDARVSSMQSVEMLDMCSDSGLESVRAPSGDGPAAPAGVPWPAAPPPPVQGVPLPMSSVPLSLPVGWSVHSNAGSGNNRVHPRADSSLYAIGSSGAMSHVSSAGSLQPPLSPHAPQYFAVQPSQPLPASQAAAWQLLGVSGTPQGGGLQLRHFTPQGGEALHVQAGLPPPNSLGGLHGGYPPQQGNFVGGQGQFYYTHPGQAAFTVQQVPQQAVTFAPAPHVLAAAAGHPRTGTLVQAGQGVGAAHAPQASLVPGQALYAPWVAARHDIPQQPHAGLDG